jgi:ribosome-binding ATPase YchF (GTP1/OBG family)
MAARPPMLHLAVIGLPQSGKTTLFSLLSGIPYEKASLNPTGPLSAEVRVVDPRLTWLHQANHPKAKLTYPTVQLYDTPSLVFEEGKERSQAFSAIGELDGLLVVLRGYDLSGPIEKKMGALRDELEQIRSELHLIDLEKVQRRIEKLQGVVKKPIPDLEAAKRELGILESLFEDISAGRRDAFEKLSPEDEKKLRAFQLFSRKPTLAIANVAEADAAAWPQGELQPIPLRLELELAGMAADERKDFIAMYGLENLVSEGFLNSLVRRMGRVVFYTVGEPEVAGWGIPAGTRAQEAAGKIHSDIEEGFIAAEVIPLALVEKHGTVRAAELKARPRLEGKDYRVQDGDILHFRHTG